MIMSRKARLDGNVACMGATRNEFRVLVGKTERKRPLRKLDAGGRIILRYE
jgi:hypothetical protein